MRDAGGSRHTVVALVLLATCTRGGPAPTGPSVPPAAGGTLIVAVGELGPLDPARATSRGALAAVAQVFDPLTAVDADGRVVPAAARSWRVSRDGLRWRFRLERRRFHDGTRVRARDFALSFDRVARRATRSLAAFHLDQVAGFRAVHDEATARRLAGVRARGRDVLVIRLARPFDELPVVLAHPALAPLPGGRAPGRRPVGNGPFRVRRASDDRAVLARYEGYRGTRPLLDGVEFRVTGADEAYRALVAGEVHVADVPATLLDAARSRFGDAGLTPSWATLSFGPNLGRPKYAKPEVRRAISLAIDREAIARTIFGGTKEPATGILPRGIRGFTERACAACELDLRRARRIVRAAFGSAPPRIRVDHLADPTSARVARAVAAGLNDAGFRAELRRHREEGYRRLLATDEHDLAQLGWLSEVPTPDGFLARQLRSGSPDNNTGFSDERFDRLISRARRARAEGRRLEAYRAAEARALELMPLVPIVFFRNRVAASANVRGFVVDGAGIFDATTVSLA